MSQRKRLKNKNLYTTVGVVVLLLVVFALMKQQQAQQNAQPLQVQQLTPTIKPVKAYQSKSLKASFEYPSDFQLEEKFNTLILNTDRGEIMIEKLHTDLADTNSYLDNISKRNNLSITDRQSLAINQYESIICTIEQKKKAYFISPYKGLIYSVSTDVSSLYPDLDKIAQSFRYEPN